MQVSTQCWMSAARAAALVWAPRCSSRVVRAANQRSTRFIHDP